MSRTFRRNKPYLIDRHVGTLDELIRGETYVRKNHERSTPERTYARMKTYITADKSRGAYGVPRWFRRLHGTLHIRRHTDRMLKYHLMNDSLDAFVPDPRTRDRRCYWW